MTDFNKIFRKDILGKYVGTMVGAQRSRYYGTDDEYICFTLTRPSSEPDINVSVTLGILVDEELKTKLNFLEDPSISTLIVNTTCERCPIQDCKERAAPAIVIEKRQQRRKVQEALKRIMEE